MFLLNSLQIVELLQIRIEISKQYYDISHFPYDQSQQIVQIQKYLSESTGATPSHCLRLIFIID